MRRQFAVVVTASLLVASAIWTGDLLVDVLLIVGVGNAGPFQALAQPVVDTICGVVAVDAIFFSVGMSYLLISDRLVLFNRADRLIRGADTSQGSKVPPLAGLSPEAALDRLNINSATAFQGARSKIRRGWLGISTWSRQLIVTDLPLSAKVGFAMVGYFALLGVQLFSTILYSLFAVEPPSTTISEVGSQYPSLFAILIVLSPIVIAPCEELFFRKAIHAHLKQGFGRVLTVIIASLLFALAHLSSLQGIETVGALWILAVVGVLLSIAYEITDGLLAPVLMHGGYNATVFAVAYLG